MNKEDIYKDDLLRSYLDTAKREKVPEGFTSKVMTQIHLEAVLTAETVKEKRRSLVPAISGVMIVLFTVAALFIPRSNRFALPGEGLMNKIHLSLPDVEMISVIEFPSALIYVLIGIAILCLADRALNKIFRHTEFSSTGGGNADNF